MKKQNIKILLPTLIIVFLLCVGTALSPVGEGIHRNLSTLLANYLPLAGGTMTGDLNMNGNDIKMGAGLWGFDGAVNEGLTVDTSGDILMGSAGSKFNLNSNNLVMGTGLIGYGGTASKGLSFDSGNEKVTLESGQFLVPNGTVVLPVIAQQSNPDVGVYFGTNQISYSINNAESLRITNTYTQFGASGGNRAQVKVETPTATNPVFCPLGDDSDTGVSWIAADSLGLTAGSELMISFTEQTGGNFIEVKAPLHYTGHQFTENFLVTSKNYGNRWDLTNVNGAGTNAIKTAAGAGGITLLTTGATAANFETTQTEDVYFSRTIQPMTCIHINLDTDLVGKEVKFGFSDNPQVEDGKYCMFLFDYSADNVNWWSHSSDGVDASLVIGPTAGTQQNLRLYLTSAGVVYFYVDDVLKGTVTGAVSDGTALYLFYGIKTEANQAEIIEVDHISAGWGY